MAAQNNQPTNRRVVVQAEKRKNFLRTCSIVRRSQEVEESYNSEPQPNIDLTK